jgi:hypothetical protein
MVSAPVSAKPAYGNAMAMNASPAAMPAMRRSAAPRGNSGAGTRVDARTASTMPAPMMMSPVISGNRPLSGPEGPVRPRVQA